MKTCLAETERKEYESFCDFCNSEEIRDRYSCWCCKVEKNFICYSFVKVHICHVFILSYASLRYWWCINLIQFPSIGSINIPVVSSNLNKFGTSRQRWCENLVKGRKKIQKFVQHKVTTETWLISTAVLRLLRISTN